MSGPLSAPARFAGPLRRTSHAEVHPNERGAALRITAPELAAPAAIDRVVAAAGAVLSGEVSGVARVVDLLAADTGVWLITAGPFGPTLGELLEAGAAVTKQGAAALLSDVGLAALAVQGIGWSLDAPDADCIVIDPAGQALLLDAPLHMSPPVAGGRPNAGWFADLVERVAGRWVPDGSFAAVAAAARTDGMSAALSHLMQVLAGQTATPDARASVRAAISGRPDHTPPTAAPDPAATMAHRFPPTELAATALGSRAGAAAGARPADPAEAGVFRFGPGVPPRGTLPEPAPVAVAAVAPAQRRRGFATLVLLVAIAILLWWLLRPAPALSVSSVHANGPSGPAHCNSTTDLRATVRTNGAAGTLTYHWLRSDGVRSGPLIKRLVAGQHEALLHLRWTVRGSGTFRGSATVTLDHPHAGSASASFRYVCA